ncbi:MAG: quinone-dependent dihydroorotate dehydrogenase [Candidatus Magasanikbacteria bacterium]|nr:quinone-dependent dihydroorotate dehydrogenase [Candidatus Magasanikbacteria bacterium]
MFYRWIIRPIFFKTDPEWIHNLAIKFLKYTSENNFLRKILKRIFFVNDPRLKVKIGNLEFENPIGLAAGFDKNIEAPLAYSMMGFGFVEFGSVTFRGQPGNPKPRLWRLPKDKSLIVYYGLCNNGAAKARRRLKDIKNKMDIPFGVSIAPTTDVPKEYMVSDYVNSFYELYKYADYITLNVSCPNVAACNIFEQISFIKELLERVKLIREKKEIKKDIFIKIGPDMGTENLDKIIDMCLEYEITGIIATNLLKDRNDLESNSGPDELKHPGGLSGKILENKSNDTISYIRKKAGTKLAIIGVGGIFTAEDAYKKIKSGADVVQLVTGFVYGGPFVIRKINKDFVKIKRLIYCCKKKDINNN